MVAAGVGDHSALAVFFREGGDFVVSSAKFESADGLLVFGLEEEAPVAGFAMIEFDQGCVNGDAVEAGLGGAESSRVTISGLLQISNITGMISGRFWVCLEM